MLGSPAGPGAPSQRGLWTSAPLPSATSYTADGFSKYGVYSLFPGGPTFGSALYSHANAFSRFTSGQFQPAPGGIFHGSHKVSDSLFSSTGYTFGAPTPPPGSPYSPIPVAQLELLTKGLNSNIIIQQAPDFTLSPKKLQITERRCDEKCCNVKQRSCLCQEDSPVSFKGKFSNGSTGCSRTNPIEWGHVNVKKEPGHPCQVAEITTSLSPVIKVEVASPTQRHGIEKEASPIGGNIPVGIAVARQRIQQPELIGSPSLPPVGLLTTVNAAAASGQIKEIARLSEIESTQSDMAASVTAGGAAGGTLLQCTDDRNTALASWPIGATQSSALTTPTLWQYPAPVPMESMVPLPVPMPPVGFQLVRDPTNGGLLLLPTTTSLEPIQQTVVWPSYAQQSPLLIPPLPPPPLQLLSSATSDYLSSSATFHQQTQTHSTRLLAVTTDTKRKIPIPSTTLIKIEADTSTLDQSKALSSMSGATGAVFSDQNLAPLVTTHVIYQHPPNLILSQSQPVETSCKSQVTSPLPCLTPPPEISCPVDEPPLAVDASNQTESPICSEDDNTLQTLPEVSPESLQQYQQESQKEMIPIEEAVPTEETEIHQDFETNNEPVNLVVTPVEKEPLKPKEVIESEKETSKPDLSGLELLSNSIVEFESCRSVVKSEVRSSIDEPIESKDIGDEQIDKKAEEVSQSVNQASTSEDKFVGLDLLCALAEQRILEESTENDDSKSKSKASRREKRKSRRHSDEPRHKKRKSDKYSDEERRHKVDLGLKKSKLKRSASEGNKCDKEGDIKCLCRSENYKLCHEATRDDLMAKYIANKNQTGCCRVDWPCMNAMELDMRMRLADLQRKFKEKQKELKKLGSRKHRHHSKKKSRNKSSHCETPPPQLDPIEITIPPEVKSVHLLKPPTLCVAESVKPSKLTKTKVENELHKEEYTWCIAENTKHLKRKSSMEERRHQSGERKSSSKKRKVGRPKRISDQYIPTETIVAKKPKTGNFVGYLMAAKEKLQKRPSISDSPPRFIDESSIFVETKNKNNNNVIVSETQRSDHDATNVEESSWETDEDEYDEHGSPHATEDAKPVFVKTEMPEEEEEEQIEEVPHVCTLTSEHLETENLRVLTAMGGLFYAGRLHAVQPPDVYSITLDGERGNRPHIMSREEILRDAIVEIAPKTIDDLQPGTRLCAYWSQQYRCLYPGSVAEPGSPNPEVDSKFISVEFDDGDNGTIAIEDIRLLPSNFPVMEYDPNPLLSLSRRKRRVSSSNNTNTTIERRGNDKIVSCEDETDTHQVSIRLEQASPDDTHKERKRLKKKKKEKRKRKHRCEEQNCTHKKHHKKHKKHKKHHYDKENINEGVDCGEATENGLFSVAPQEVEDVKPIVLQEKSSRTILESVPERMEDGDDNDDAIADEDEKTEDDDDEEYIPNTDREVTIDDIQEDQKMKRIRNRQASCESSKSAMSAFLTEKHMWSWYGKETKKTRIKGKKYYHAIQRGKEKISLKDTAVFCSTSKPERPYIGQITSLYEKSGGHKYVKVKWYYHPEETVVEPSLLHPGGVFASEHFDENDVQTISHKCSVVSLEEYLKILETKPQIGKEMSLYYLAGNYEARQGTLEIFPTVPMSHLTK